MEDEGPVEDVQVEWQVPSHCKRTRHGHEQARDKLKERGIKVL